MSYIVNNDFDFNCEFCDNTISIGETYYVAPNGYSYCNLECYELDVWDWGI